MSDPTPQYKPTLTDDELTEINRLIVDLIGAERAYESAKNARDGTRAALLDALKPHADANPNVLPGLTVKTVRKVAYDETAALEYLTLDENIAAAGDMLAVRRSAVGILIGAAIFTPALKSVFEVRDAGYQDAVKNGTIKGLPFESVAEEKQLSVQMNALKYGGELRASVILSEGE